MPPWDSQTTCHLNIFSESHENIQRNEVYLHSFFNYAISIIFGQLHAPASLFPGKNPLHKSVCIGHGSLFFIGQYVRAWDLLSAVVLSVLTKFDRVSKYLCRRSTVESSSLRCVVNFKDRVLLPACKQQACCAVRSYDRTCNGGQKSFRTFKTFVRYISQTELLCVFSKRSSMCVQLHKHVGGPS